MPMILNNSTRFNQLRRGSTAGSSASLSRSSGSESSFQHSFLADWFSTLTTGSPSPSSTGSTLRASDSSNNKEDACSRHGSESAQSSSSNSSGNSTPRAASPTPPPHAGRRQIISDVCQNAQRRRCSTGAMMPFNDNELDVDGNDDHWGQFVDPAEAENEITKYSRILSRKEVSRVPRGYHHLRRSSVC